MLRTELLLATGRIESKIQIQYREERSLGIWVPASMNEEYRSGIRPGTFFATATIGRATYSNFRRFGVSTEVISASVPE